MVSPGEADRRAVGRRRGRLPGRQLPAAVVGVERQVPRHACATTGAASDQTLCASSPTASPAARDLYAATGRRPVRQRQLRHRARRLHAARPRLLQRQAQRGQRRGQPRRRRRTTARGTAAPRGRPTTRRSTRCARRQQRNFLATLLLSQGVPMLCGGDEIGRTQRGNNNAYCQDNEISWFDWDARRRGAARRSRGGSIGCAASTRCSAAAAGSRAGRSTAREVERHRLVHARRRRR